MEYVLYCSLTALIVYGIWFFRNIIKSGRARKIHTMYQSILDQKLLPLGFEKKQAFIGGREKTVSYKKNSLEITLDYEISFDTNRVNIANGGKSRSIDVSSSEETKGNLIHMVEEWLADNR